ncbi:MAG: aspartate kinase [Crocinitomicaceae bacterium]|jgi:aspartate kinase|nr:aspartate kinase [Crocinitomicaceae bacterium]
MRVFKFGGASVKDPNAVRNVSSILRLFEGEKRIVVISAMGKTTNALEEVVKFIWEKDHDALRKQVEFLRSFHDDILADLFGAEEEDIHRTIRMIFDRLENMDNHERRNYNELYDQVVSLGEIISTHIVAAFLQKEGQKARWADATKLVRTNHKFREADIDWRTTEELIQQNFLPHFSNFDIQVTQGFIGHTTDAKTTTLGREGSDFTAAIFAFCVGAQDVTIWKDVPGMLNADPKYFDNTIKLDQISFKEAIELSYYGASVIHPKTVKPLQNKGIPLYVKSFIDPHAEGTAIQEDDSKDQLIPSFIFKMDQVLISITPRDFSFIVEENLSDIFNRLAQANAKINVMQNSALSFQILLDRSKIDLSQLLGLFENNYLLHVEENLELVTIRHYDDATIARVQVDKKILMEQKTTETARLVLKNANE